MNLYIRREHVLHGPFTVEEVAGEVERGRVHLHDEAAWEGTDEWARLDELVEFVVAEPVADLPPRPEGTPRLITMAEARAGSSGAERQAHQFVAKKARKQHRAACLAVFIAAGFELLGGWLRHHSAEISGGSQAAATVQFVLGGMLAICGLFVMARVRSALWLAVVGYGILSAILLLGVAFGAGLPRLIGVLLRVLLLLCMAGGLGAIDTLRGGVRLPASIRNSGGSVPPIFAPAGPIATLPPRNRWGGHLVILMLVMVLGVLPLVLGLRGSVGSEDSYVVGRQQVYKLPFTGGIKGLWRGDNLIVTEKPLTLPDGRLMNWSFERCSTSEVVWGDELEITKDHALDLVPEMEGKGWIKFTLPENEVLIGQTLEFTVSMSVTRPKPFAIGFTNETFEGSWSGQLKVVTAEEDRGQRSASLASVIGLVVTIGGGLIFLLRLRSD